MKCALCCLDRGESCIDLPRSGRSGRIVLRFASIRVQTLAIRYNSCVRCNKSTFLMFIRRFPQITHALARSGCSASTGSQHQPRSNMRQRRATMGFQRESNKPRGVQRVERPTKTHGSSSLGAFLQLSVIRGGTTTSNFHKPYLGSDTLGSVGHYHHGRHSPLPGSLYRVGPCAFCKPSVCHLILSHYIRAAS